MSDFEKARDEVEETLRGKYLELREQAQAADKHIVLLEGTLRALRDSVEGVLWSREGGRCIYCACERGQAHRYDPPNICGLKLHLDAARLVLPGG